MFIGRRALLTSISRILPPKNTSKLLQSNISVISVGTFYTSHRLLETKKSEEQSQRELHENKINNRYEKDERGYVHFSSTRDNHLYFTIPFTNTKVKWSYIIALIALGVLIKLYLLIEEAPVTHRKRLMLLTNEYLMEEADSIFQQFKTLKLPTSHPDYQLVQSLGASIASACMSQQDKLPTWEFIVVDLDETNALALPNGKVVVFSGLITALERNPDQIAGVMSHEIAHVLMEHGREGASFSSIVLVASFFVRGLFTYRVPSWILNVALEYPRSRAQEYEADLIGTMLMIRANKNPLGLAQGFEKLANLNIFTTHEYLSTHPTFEHRVERLKQFAEKAVELQKNNPTNEKKSRLHWYDGFEELQNNTNTQLNKQVE